MTDILSSSMDVVSEPSVRFIEIITKDDLRFIFPASYIEICSTLKAFYDEQISSGFTNISYNIDFFGKDLEKVIEWFKHHIDEGHPYPVLKTPIRNGLKPVLDEWEFNYVNVHPNEFAQPLLLARFFKCDLLCNLFCARIACCIKEDVIYPHIIGLRGDPNAKGKKVIKTDKEQFLKLLLDFFAIPRDIPEPTDKDFDELQELYPDLKPDLSCFGINKNTDNNTDNNITAVTADNDNNNNDDNDNDDDDNDDDDDNA